MHQAEPQRFVRIDDALAHHEVHRPRHAQQLHEQILAAFVRQQAEAQGRAAHPRAARGDAEVASQGQREAGLDGDAVDGGDGELVDAAQHRVDALGDRAQAVVGADAAVVAVVDFRHQAFAGHLNAAIAFQVVAGAEGAPAAGEDQHAHAVVHLRLGHGLHQVALDARRHAVQPLRRGEAEPGDARFAHAHLETSELPSVHRSPPIRPALRRA